VRACVRACVRGGVQAFIPLAALAHGQLRLLEHLTERLPTYMVPARVVALQAFPLLPNGKVNLRALAGGSVLGDVVQRTGGTVAGDATTTDSLGVVRALSAGAVATARETQVANVMRAFLMYGVIVDHWAGCADGGSCRMIVEDMVWRQPDEMQLDLLWMDTLVRMMYVTGDRTQDLSSLPFPANVPTSVLGRAAATTSACRDSSW
jgi:hypothetical protein